MKKINIAIDGPSAAGKSTIADQLSKKIHYVHLDTGAMYRCVGLLCVRSGIALKDEDAVMELLKDAVIDQTEDGKSFLNGEDVSELIRTDEISLAASDVSTLGAVRRAMVGLQQKMTARKGFIVDGRDIGTVVLPDAELKIFMTATVEARAIRRYKQNLKNGMEADLEQIKADIAARDYQDTHREESPLRKAEDAVEIDTSELSIEEVTEAVLALALPLMQEDEA